jgi:hypothetical protein
MGTEHSGSGTSLSSVVKVWTTIVTLLLVTWFLFAWLILDRHVLDAAGESVGTAFALAVVASLIGALRGSSRSP